MAKAKVKSRVKVTVGESTINGEKVGSFTYERVERADGTVEERRTPVRNWNDFAVAIVKGLHTDAPPKKRRR